MEEKKVKMSLGTAVCIFIIFVLIVALICMYYYGFIKKNQKIADLNNKINVLNSKKSIKQDEEKIEATKTNIENESVDLTESNSKKIGTVGKLDLGDYKILPDLQILGEEYFLMADYGSEMISFFNDETFIAYLGMGGNISGTFNVVDDKVNCIINEYESEYSPKQKTNGKIVFKMRKSADESTSIIEIVEVSDSFKVKETTIGEEGWILTDTEKDMTLANFKKGIKFFSL